MGIILGALVGGGAAWAFCASQPNPPTTPLGIALCGGSSGDSNTGSGGGILTLIIGVVAGGIIGGIVEK